MTPRTIPLLRPWSVALLALGVAGFSGLLIAVRPPLGIASVLAVFYGPLALLNLPAALAGWVPIPFIENLPIVWVGPTFALLVLLFAWLGTLPAQRRIGFPGLRGQRRAVVATLLVVLWWTLSLAWAPEPGLGTETIVAYVIAAGITIIAMTTLTEERHVRWVLVAFVTGAVLSVLAGLVSSGLDPAASALDSAAQDEGRLVGGGGDPNYLAAGLVPAAVLATALVVRYRHPLVRIALGFGIAIVLAGLVATESRGGLVAAVGAALAALVILRDHRQHVLAALAVVGTVAALWFVAFPGAWARVTAFDGGGNGRSDLWRVALRVTGDHPFKGIGVGNFETQARRYVRRPGKLTFVRMIVDRPHVAHNTYLQTLAEQGIVGLVLWLSAVGAFLAATRRAGRVLDRVGKPDLAMLARALLVAQIAMLVALFFITDGYDKRLWLLLSLGPVLLAIARRSESPARA